MGNVQHQIAVRVCDVVYSSTVPEQAYARSEHGSPLNGMPNLAIASRFLDQTQQSVYVWTSTHELKPAVRNRSQTSASQPCRRANQHLRLLRQLKTSASACRCRQAVVRKAWRALPLDGSSSRSIDRASRVARGCQQTHQRHWKRRLQLALLYMLQRNTERRQSDGELGEDGAKWSLDRATFLTTSRQACRLDRRTSCISS